MKTRQLMRKRYRRCARLQRYRAHTVQDCDKKSSEMTKILRLKVYFYTGEETPVTYN